MRVSLSFHTENVKWGRVILCFLNTLKSAFTIPRSDDPNLCPFMLVFLLPSPPQMCVSGHHCGKPPRSFTKIHRHSPHVACQPCRCLYLGYHYGNYGAGQHRAGSPCGGFGVGLLRPWPNPASTGLGAWSGYKQGALRGPVVIPRPSNTFRSDCF